MKRDFHDIPHSKNWKRVQAITEGWSEDEKYYVETQTGAKRLLRISDASAYEAQKSAYEALTQLKSDDGRIATLLESGFCENRKKIYRIFTWVEGKNLHSVLPKLTAQEQYKLGLKAGDYLRQIHQIQAPKNTLTWATHFNQKIDRKIQTYTKCAIKFDHADTFIQYINQHRFLLENRPQCFHHGDYHIRNMLINHDGVLGIIDFNRLEFGDPWEEFNRIVWCASASSHFASGRINGYFGETVPDDFFRLLALYLSVNLLSSIPWAIPFGQQQVDIMLDQAKQLLAWYDHFDHYKPSWYLSTFE